MYAIKELIEKNLQIRENSNNPQKKIMSLYIAYVLSCLVLNIRYEEKINKINKAHQLYVHTRNNKFLQFIEKETTPTMEIINKALDSLKDEVATLSIDTGMIRRKIRGFIGVETT